MQIKLKVKALHHGEPMEVDIDTTVTTTEMIELYREAPEIIRNFKTMMREEKAIAKAEKNQRKGK